MTRSQTHAATLGAAISLIPAGRVEEASRAGELDETLFENFKEVCNIMVTVLNQPGVVPFFLSDVSSPPEAAIPEELNETTPLGIRFSVDGYGDCSMTLAVS